MERQKPRLTVLSGPSGVGKGTLVKALRKNHPQLWLSVSATTRAARLGEVEAIDYFFKSNDLITPETIKKIKSTDRIVVGYDYDAQKRKDQIEEDTVWKEIREAAKTNKSLQRALDRAKILYRLSKDNPL